MTLTRTETLDRLAHLLAVVRCTEAPALEWDRILRPLIQRGSDALTLHQVLDLEAALDASTDRPHSNVARLRLMAEAEALYSEAYAWDYQS